VQRRRLLPAEVHRQAAQVWRWHWRGCSGGGRRSRTRAWAPCCCGQFVQRNVRELAGPLHRQFHRPGALIFVPHRLDGGHGRQRHGAARAIGRGRLLPALVCLRRRRWSGHPLCGLAGTARLAVAPAALRQAQLLFLRPRRGALLLHHLDLLPHPLHHRRRLGDALLHLRQRAVLELLHAVRHRGAQVLQPHRGRRHAGASRDT